MTGVPNTAQNPTSHEPREVKMAMDRRSNQVARRFQNTKKIQTTPKNSTAINISPNNEAFIIGMALATPFQLRKAKKTIFRIDKFSFNFYSDVLYIAILVFEEVVELLVLLVV